MPVVIDPAQLPEDRPVIEALFTAYLGFLRERVPEHWQKISSKYPIERVPELVSGYLLENARPTGEILIARLDGKPVGCAMMRQTEPGIVEIQRVYVAPEARGHGIGKDLTLRLMALARKDGQRIMRLDTGPALTEAIGLYRSLGFRERTAYHSDYEALEGILVYFEADLLA
ncbi:acetyltransferase (GNAT) family protein [Aliiruegeria haliotis]|uniref:Acetyltransferase (GNAT) family protein n=1 Tax=Aliiruegeria haliotis TaxID=1280846 RepID=A0A2T0RVH3_9RHOB|nr:GNAT family N-acetyltransferase [Aliiruegeria haliotis]PRY25148.1 acetyltransferase (GNAT) family protein [Aliiruegeria haliotis]